MHGKGLRKLAASDQLLGEEPKPLMTRLKWFKEEVMLYNWQNRSLFESFERKCKFMERSIVGRTSSAKRTSKYNEIQLVDAVTEYS